jgi:effector-binding domain-containing protein
MHISNMERITIQRLPAIIVASHRRMLKRREDLIPLFNNVINPEIQRIGCVRTLPIYGFTMEHEPEYKTEDIDTEYCLQVEEMYDDTDIIKFKQLPEVPKAVCLMHTGTYETINESFAEVMHYIETNGYKIAGLYRIQFEEGQHNQ